MEFGDLAAGLRLMPKGSAFQIANSARPPADYVFANYLPEQNRASYDVGSGSMRIISTMAGLVGMDSPYPEGGIIEVTSFKENTAKIANRTGIPEAAMRELQQLVKELRASGLPTVKMVLEEIVNFLDKLIIQPHLDTMEYLRGQAIQKGKIDWIFNGKRLLVDYKIPEANKASYTGNDGFGGSSSQFWAGIRKIQRVLKWNVREYLTHPDTLEMIVSNEANSIEIVDGNQTDGYELARLVNDTAGATRRSSDRRDRVKIRAYSLETNVLDPNNPNGFLELPFMETGRLVGIGNNTANRYFVGQGSTENPEDKNALGYTHIAPSVEGGGTAGRWAKVYIPEGEEWRVEGRGVTNGLPVIENPNKLAILETVMA